MTIEVARENYADLRRQLNAAEQEYAVWQKSRYENGRPSTRTDLNTMRTEQVAVVNSGNWEIVSNQHRGRIESLRLQVDAARQKLAALRAENPTGQAVRFKLSDCVDQAGGMFMDQLGRTARVTQHLGPYVELKMDCPADVRTRVGLVHVELVYCRHDRLRFLEDE